MENCTISGKSQGILKWRKSGDPVEAAGKKEKCRGVHGISDLEFISPDSRFLMATIKTQIWFEIIILCKCRCGFPDRPKSFAQFLVQ